MDWIPPASPDVDGAPSASSSSSTTSASLSHLRLKHAREMLDSDPDQFVYAGEVRERNPPPFPPDGTRGEGRRNKCRLERMAQNSPTRKRGFEFMLHFLAHYGK